MSQIDDSTVPVRSPQAVFRWVEEQGVVVVPGQDEINVLNPVAARIWELIDGTRDVAAISRLVAEEFEVDDATARADTLQFLGSLRRHGII